MASLDLCLGEESKIYKLLNYKGKEYASFNFHLCSDENLFLLNSCIVLKILEFLSSSPSSGYTITLSHVILCWPLRMSPLVETVHPCATCWIFFIDKYFLFGDVNTSSFQMRKNEQIYQKRHYSPIVNICNQTCFIPVYFKYIYHYNLFRLI